MRSEIGLIPAKKEVIVLKPVATVFGLKSVLKKHIFFVE